MNANTIHDAKCRWCGRTIVYRRDEWWHRSTGTPYCNAMQSNAKATPR